jgi:hypothetical protein
MAMGTIKVTTTITTTEVGRRPAGAGRGDGV